MVRMSTSKDLPTVVQPPLKERNVRKTVVISLAIVCVIAIIISGFIVSFYFMHETAKEALKVKSFDFERDGKIFKETVEKAEDNVYKYTVYGPDESYVIVADYNRRVMTVKSKIGGVETCVSLPFAGIDIKDEWNLKDDEWVRANETTKMFLYLEIDDHYILDHEVTGSEAQQMCHGKPMYWGVPKGEPGHGQDPQRTKRFLPVVIFVVLVLIPTPAY